MTAESNAETAVAGAASVGTMTIKELGQLISSLIAQDRSASSTTGSETQDVTKSKGSSDYRKDQVDSDTNSEERYKLSGNREAEVASSFQQDLLSSMAEGRRKASDRYDTLVSEQQKFLSGLDKQYLEVANLAGKNAVTQQASSALSVQQNDALELLSGLGTILSLELADADKLAVTQAAIKKLQS